MKKYDNEIDKLFDEENTEPIYLYDDNDKEIAFEQIAVIPKGDEIFAILKPIEPMDGVEEDEALVFVIGEDENGEEMMELLDDEDEVDEIFGLYYKLLEENED
ncbi:MAG: DUF1292 domain-containing protein [Clostridia bacterium]|nr:DUF1292 domain-containing protein [Clostridia bacterium]